MSCTASLCKQAIICGGTPRDTACCKLQQMKSAAGAVVMFAPPEIRDFACTMLHTILISICCICCFVIIMDVFFCMQDSEW